MITKALVQTLYDIQAQRIQTGNRICAEIKARMGNRPGVPEEKCLEKDSIDYLNEARKEFKRLSDAFVLTNARKYVPANFSCCRIITDPGLLLFIEWYEKQVDQEEEMTKVIEKMVHQQPLWNGFLKNVQGCGPLMSAVILAYLDPKKAHHISGFWKYAGLDVAGDGRGRGRYAEHLVDRQYRDRNGNEKTKKSITFNPFLKTKLVGVLSGCFLRQSPETCPYRKVYDDYKHRLENHERHKEKTPMHRHKMAIRYMTKMFLQDLWLAWREIEGLPITQPYHEAVLNHKHGE